MNHPFLQYEPFYSSGRTLKTSIRDYKSSSIHNCRTPPSLQVKSLRDLLLGYSPDDLESAIHLLLCTFLSYPRLSIFCVYPPFKPCKRTPLCKRHLCLLQPKENLKRTPYWLPLLFLQRRHGRLTARTISLH